MTEDPKRKIGAIWGDYGHAKSSEISPFDKEHRTICSPKPILDSFRNIASLAYLSKVANFSYLAIYTTVYMAPALGLTTLEFQQDLWYQKTRVPVWLTCMVCLALLIQLRLVTDRHTDTGP